MLTLQRDVDAAIARQMAAELPRAELRIVPEAGHAIHLERPERYAELVTEFVHRSGHRVAQFQEGRTTWT